MILLFSAFPHLVINIQGILLSKDMHWVEVGIHHGRQVAQRQGLELAHGIQAVIQLGAQPPSEGNLGDGG